MFIKKYLIPIAMALSLLFAGQQCFAEAVEIGVGGTVLFNWWNPAWNNGRFVLYSPERIKIIDTHAPKYPIMQQFMYGPDISIRFLRNWEICPSFRYGTSSTSGANMSIYPFGYRVLKISIKRHDIYANAGYYILEYLKIFIGLRAEIFDYNTNYRHLDFGGTTPNFFIVNVEGKLLHFTPELGIHFAVPVTRLFTFLCDISGTFMSGSDKSKYKNAYDRNGPNFAFSKIPTARYYAVGCNASLALQINIPVIDTSVSLGGYYRVTRYIQKTTDRGLFDYDSSHDHNFGASCSASYNFTFNSHQQPRLWMPRPEY
jgi:hypothetical protein